MWKRVCARVTTKLYRLGIRGEVSHSTLADANRERDWRIYYDLAQLLIRRARTLYQNESIGFGVGRNGVCAGFHHDRPVPETCFPWARFPPDQGGHQTAYPVGFAGLHPHIYRDFSREKWPMCAFWTNWFLEAGAFYVMDRGYLDFFRLYYFVLAGAFFVTRSKARIQFVRLEVRPVEPATGVRSDHLVRPRKLNPASRITPPSCGAFTMWIAKRARVLSFSRITLVLPALTIALLYKKNAGTVELFFKWIKQHLRIKHFLRH